MPLRAVSAFTPTPVSAKAQSPANSPPSDGESDLRPVILPMARPHPLPLTVLGIYENGIDYTSRIWREGDAAFCRICPRAKCHFTTVPGVCDTCLARDVDQIQPNFAPGEAPSLPTLPGRPGRLGRGPR